MKMRCLIFIPIKFFASPLFHFFLFSPLAISIAIQKAHCHRSTESRQLINLQVQNSHLRTSLNSIGIRMPTIRIPGVIPELPPDIEELKERSILEGLPHRSYWRPLRERTERRRGGTMEQRGLEIQNAAQTESELIQEKNKLDQKKRELRQRISEKDQEIREKDRKIHKLEQEKQKLEQEEQKLKQSIEKGPRDFPVSEVTANLFEMK
ncbi:hypothetical protein HDV64DRAFT_159831 [Trichoderma sp. TUCIM 5745]